MMGWIEIGSRLYQIDSIVKVEQYDRKGTYYINMWTAHPKYIIKSGLIVDSHKFKKIVQNVNTFSFTNPQTRDQYYKKLKLLADQNVVIMSKNKDDMVKLE